MNHHANGGQGWKKAAAAARAAELLARSMVGTLQSYIEQRDKAYRELEAVNELQAARITALEATVAALQANPVLVPRPRTRMQQTRSGEAWTLRVGDKDGGTSCVLHVGLLEDGSLGEAFLRFGKAERGSHGASMADLALTYFSMLLQYGAPLDELLAKMIGAADESGGVTRVRTADGWTADPDVPMCRSLRDYVGKKLRARFATVAE